MSEHLAASHNGTQNTCVTFFFFFWTIPYCFSCSKREADPGVGMPCTSGPCPSSSATDTQSELSDSPSGVTHPTLPSFLSWVFVLPLQGDWVGRSRKFSAVAVGLPGRI